METSAATFALVATIAVGWIPFWSLGTALGKERHDFQKREVRIRDLDDGLRKAVLAIGDNRGGARRREVRLVLRVREKGDLSLARFLDPGDAGDLDIRRADDLAANEPGQLF